MKRSKFSLSHTKLFSCDIGELVPCGLVEVLPGDSFQHSTMALVRAAPMLAPIMHPMTVRIHHWFVPHRLVWAAFESFITGGSDGNDSTVRPTIVNTGGDAVVGGLADYFGVTPGNTTVPYSALPTRAYQLIWNEFYRDQDLQTPVAVSQGNGVDVSTFRGLQRVSWEKDYFTSSRPWEQKGPVVTLPLGTRANVKGIGAVDGVTTSTLPGNVRQADGTLMTGNQIDSSGTNVRFKSTTTGVTGSGNPIDVWADLSTASAVTVNVLRQALALQRFEEVRARYGSRYPEFLAYLGVRSSDARLSRPEYLGGGKQVIQFSEVLQTGADGTNPVGTLRGHGIAAMRSNRYRRFFEEHGYVLTLMSVRPKAIYASGLPRTFNRVTKYDYWNKELQHIGQQAVLNKEVYMAHTTPDGVFGYQDRYDEYRREESSIGGEFRTLLNFWHDARIFASNPSLNSSFVSCVSSERPFAVPGQDVLYVHARHSIQARRLVAPVGTSFTF